jgi:cyanophycin synthetase
VLAPELDALRTLGRAALRNRGELSSAAQSLERAHAASYMRIWTQAAEALGAQIEELGDGFLRGRRGENETIMHRHLVMLNHPSTAALALDKSLVHHMLLHAGLPMPPYLEAAREAPASGLAFLESQPGPCVVKPANGTSGGTGVTCGVESADDLWRSWLRAARWDPRVLIERQSDGEEYRLLFLDGELLGAVQRRRPSVTGDGQASVLGLIEAENERRIRAGSSDVARLVSVDLDCELAVRRCGHTLHTVPAAGERVVVKGTVSENASADNSTATLSQELLADARRATDALQLSFAGIDLVTPDPARSLADAGGTILEVNATPGLHYHYQVDDPENAPAVAVAVLERVLGERRRSR